MKITENKMEDSIKRAMQLLGSAEFGQVTQELVSAGQLLRAEVWDCHRKMDCLLVQRNKLAYEILMYIRSEKIDPRSKAADMVLEFLGVGTPDGPRDMNEWLEQYRR